MTTGTGAAQTPMPARAPQRNPHASRRSKAPASLASPWLLGFSGQPNAMRTAVIAGVVMLALALWALATDKRLGAANRDRIAH